MKFSAQTGTSKTTIGLKKFVTGILMIIFRILNELVDPNHARLEVKSALMRFYTEQ